MNIFTELEHEVMDQLYFISSYKEILNSIDCGKKALEEALKSLLQKGYIYQMAFSQGNFDYEIVRNIDSHSMDKYSYLATKKGMIAYNRLD